jgi:hypothetical protein
MAAPVALLPLAALPLYRTRLIGRDAEIAAARAFLRCARVGRVAVTLLTAVTGVPP